MSHARAARETSPNRVFLLTLKVESPPEPQCRYRVRLCGARNQPSRSRLNGKKRVLRLRVGQTEHQIFEASHRHRPPEQFPLLYHSVFMHLPAVFVGSSTVATIISSSVRKVGLRHGDVGLGTRRVPVHDISTAHDSGWRPTSYMLGCVQFQFSLIRLTESCERMKCG